MMDFLRLLFAAKMSQNKFHIVDSFFAEISQEQYALKKTVR